MKSTTLYDPQRRPIGRIIERDGGSQEALDRRNRTLGHYEPQTGRTEDAAHRTVGYGNLLPSLITRSL